MQSISNDRYDAIIRLLSGFVASDKETTTQAAERRRKATKMMKYLKRNKDVRKDN